MNRERMNRVRKLTALIGLCVCVAFTVAYASAEGHSTTGNSYYLYTGAFKLSDSGVVAVPSRFKWSVETGWRGTDARGNTLPDTRVLLRLYDPDRNCTALTAQMDLETAEQLQRSLADIIAIRRKSPDYHSRPQLNDSSLIPAGRLKGIDENGKAIIELEPKQTK